jgi:hypothetical protein
MSSRTAATICLAALVALLPAPGEAGPQRIIAGPFLQSASPTGITVVWETNSDTDTRVDYGITEDLGTEVIGTALVTPAMTIIHKTTLTNLQPETYYYYQAITRKAKSEILHFKTPALTSAEQPFRFIVYSDTQHDGSTPDKHAEIVNDGMIGFITENFGPDLSEEVAFVLHAGDIVDSNAGFDKWREQFFEEAQNLLQYTPVYTVLGNHERVTDDYFRYFSLPDNDTAGYEGHWYHFDYSNVRVVGLNSNYGYRIQTQLDWLDGVLVSSCNDLDIDFVFVQLHHPYKSEPWTPGEIAYTGEVIERMEQFSTDCGKPSIHFFGHTHAYARGQSRDAEHLWVNVATAEGGIRYWGEYHNFDYPEFQKTLLEWGFVLVEVEAGSDPRLRLRRVSRGNDVVARDNEVVDDITIRAGNLPPLQPEPLFPTLAQSPIDPDAVSLKAGAFFDPDDDGHLESHFQVTASQGDYSAPVVEEWRRSENFYSPPGATGVTNGYYSIDTAAAADITASSSAFLQPGTTYHWRVRYRDGALGWSDWSVEASFTTGPSSYGGNLLVNPGAEEGVLGWTVIDPPLESLYGGECYSVLPNSGSWVFAVGGVCYWEGDYGEAYQTVELSSEFTAARFGGYMRNYSGGDLPELWLVFNDGAGGPLGSTAILSNPNEEWASVEAIADLPPGTASIEFHICGTRLDGMNNDSYFDDLVLKVGTSYPAGQVPGVDTIVLSKFAEDDLLLSWDASCSPGDTDYEIYEGTIDGLFENHIPKLCSTGGAMTASITPSAGSSYYLVVPRNAFNEGSYGFRGDGSERPRGPAACNEQALGACD